METQDEQNVQLNIRIPRSLKWRLSVLLARMDSKITRELPTLVERWVAEKEAELKNVK